MDRSKLKENKVYYTTNFDVLQEVCMKTYEVKNNDLDMGNFIRRLGRYVSNKSGMILVSFGEDKKINGCMVLSRHIDGKGEYLWIDFAWISPKARHMRAIYEEEVIGTCKNRGIKRIQMRMARGYKAMKKLYGTVEVARILERKV